MVKQISIFLKNQPGELMKVTGLLKENGINIKALTVAETADFGILRIVVNDPDKCVKVLKDQNFLVDLTEIMAIEMKDQPGGLHDIAVLLGSAGVNIEYLYAFSHKSASNAILLVAITKEHQKKAVDTLKAKKIKVFTQEEVMTL